MDFFRTTRKLVAGMIGVGAALVASTATAADEAPAAPATEISVAEVKQLFAAQCSWCHGAYGMKAAKGPQLAGTQLTEKQVIDVIKNGRTGMMPGFKKNFSEEQITAMAKYIKALKPEP